MFSFRSKLSPLFVAGLMIAIGVMPPAARASGVGLFHPHWWGWGMPVGGGMGTSSLVSSSSLMPMAVTQWPVTTGFASTNSALVPMAVTQWPVTSSVASTNSALVPMAVTQWPVTTGFASTNSALVPMSLAPTGLSSNVVATVNIPTVSWSNGNASAPAAILGTGAAGTNNALLPMSVTPAAQAGTASNPDIWTEYTAYAIAENAANPAGVGIASTDLTQFGTSFASLSNAVGGSNRLASIGRFLKTKLNDPNFRSKAFDLFGRFIGLALPQYQPLIDGFIGLLGQGSGSGSTPPPPTNGGMPPGLFYGGELKVRVTFDNSPPQTQGPGADTQRGPLTGQSPMAVLKATVQALGGKIISETPDSLKVQKADGQTITLSPDKPPQP